MAGRAARYGVGDPAGVANDDPLGAGEGEPDGVTDGLGVRDGLGDGEDGDGDGGRETGDGELGAGLEVPGFPPGWDAPAGADTGRTRMYSASTARNRPEMTRVEVRGRPLMRHPRWPGRCQGRPRR